MTEWRGRHRLAYVEITRAEHPPAQRNVHGCASQTTGWSVGPALTNAQSDTMGDDKCANIARKHWCTSYRNLRSRDRCIDRDLV